MNTFYAVFISSFVDCFAFSLSFYLIFPLSTMDKSQSESSRGKVKYEDFTMNAQRVNSQLLTIENILQIYDNDYNKHELCIFKCIKNCCRVERCILHCLANCKKTLWQIETTLATARCNLAKLENRISIIDGRRSNPKREQERQNLVIAIIEKRNKIEDLIEILRSEKNNIATISAKLKSIKELTNADKVLASTVAERMKRNRQEIIAERNELLAMKNSFEKDG